MNSTAPGEASSLYAVPQTLLPSGVQSLTYEVPFEPATTLVVGFNPAGADGIDHIIMFANEGFASGMLGKKWSGWTDDGADRLGETPPNRSPADVDASRPKAGVEESFSRAKVWEVPRGARNPLAPGESPVQVRRTVIELDDVAKYFGEVKAVDGITLTVPRGEFFAVLGPNAAGKTTTIKMLVGLIKPTRGSARVAGFDVQSQPLEARNRLAYVPDFPFLYDKLTPWEFLRFTARLFRMSDGRMEASMADLVPRFNLEPWLHKPIEGLSHGTRQRVAIASALLHDPEVFVIDEPMVGLDPHHARVVKDTLRERARKGMTVFLSTHQIYVAEEMADRIGIIHRGRLVAVGTAAELHARAGTDGALEKAFLGITEGEAEEARQAVQTGA